MKSPSLRKATASDSESISIRGQYTILSFLALAGYVQNVYQKHRFPRLKPWYYIFRFATTSWRKQSFTHG